MLARGLFLKGYRRQHTHTHRFIQGWAMGMRSFQKNATFLCSFAFFSKERNVLAFFCILYKIMWPSLRSFAFFCVLYKRMRHSLRSFAFFIKECGVLCVLCILLRSFAFFCVLYLRTLRSVRSFAFFIKECGVLLRSL